MNNTVLIVTGTFYKDIAKNMVFKAIETLADNDFSHECINVPGAFEVPAVISSLLSNFFLSIKLCICNKLKILNSFLK